MGEKQGRREGKTRRVWALPTRTDYPMSEDAILREFRRLDLAGDGRLTFLTVKSALELEDLGDSVSDSDLRIWLRQHDRGNKGYLDLQDFKNIYTGKKSSPVATEGSHQSDAAQSLLPAGKGDLLRL